MPAPARTPSHRRRFLFGLAAALLLGVGLGLFLVTAARTAERNQRSERKAVITFRVLTAAIERAEAVRQAADRFAASHPEIRSIRVVLFEGIRLEASTDPADRGAKAAPRRLERDEKPLYDLGQKLRAAVSENRESAAAGEALINEEISAVRLADGGMELSGPLEREGEVAGMVQVRTAPDPSSAPAPPQWLPALAAVLAPLVLLFLAALGLGERRIPLGLVSAVLLLLALGGYARYALGVLESERRETGSELAAQVKSEAEKAGVPADPPGWDVNLYRQPRRLLTAGGTVDAARLGEELRRDAGGLFRSVTVIALMALGLLAFAGLGGAARVGTALVEHRVAYLYTLPILLAMVLLVFLPFSYSAVLSLTNSNIYNSNKPLSEIWVGLQNFKDILSDVHVVQRTPEGLVFDYANFYWTLGFTIVWTITNVTIGVTLGLLLALALNTRGLALRPVYRVLLILPWAVPTYITALVFRGMFHQQFGVINQMRQLLGFDPVAWFDHPLTSFLAVLTTNGYLSFSFMMVVSLGALQSIPSDLYEAARVDGASRWQQFRAITLPSLRPALVPAVILSVIWTFNQILVIFLVSAGQPAGATEILISQAYKVAFEQYRYGYAAAYSMLIFVILFFYGLFQNRMTRATEAISE